MDEYGAMTTLPVYSTPLMSMYVSLPNCTVLSVPVSLYSNLKLEALVIITGELVLSWSSPVAAFQPLKVKQAVDPLKFRQIQPLVSSRGLAYTFPEALKEAGIPEAMGS